MMTNQLIILKDVPGVTWDKGNSYQPVCREHHFALDAGSAGNGSWVDNEWDDDDWCDELRYLEGPHVIELPRSLGDIRRYIHKKLESKRYSEAKLIDLDGLLVPVSRKDKVATGDNEYFISSQIKNSRRGDQLVVYAGKKGQKDKTQVFIDPEHRRMSFDQSNLNPTDVFVKLEATFKDGTRHTIESRGEDE